MSFLFQKSLTCFNNWGLLIFEERERERERESRFVELSLNQIPSLISILDVVGVWDHEHWLLILMCSRIFFFFNMSWHATSQLFNIKKNNKKRLVSHVSFFHSTLNDNDHFDTKLKSWGQIWHSWKVRDQFDTKARGLRSFSPFPFFFRSFRTDGSKSMMTHFRSQ